MLCCVLDGERFSVEYGFNKHVAPIPELERKEGMLLDQKTQKNFVALPEGERKDFVAALPGQHALAALT